MAELPDDPNAYVEDDLDRLMRPKEEAAGGDHDSEESEDKKKNRGPKPTDWRSGPAQYWYGVNDLCL
jgi:hypothetical protein